jgi:hypothetical protein
MRVASSLALACVCAVALNAQGQLSGPVSGFVYDKRSGAIRLINGLPGASTLGAALNLRPLRAAVLRSDLDLAVGIDHESGAISIVRNLSRQPSERLYDGWLEEISGFSVDTSGKRLFVWSKSRSKLVVVSDLMNEPAVSASMDTSVLGEVVCAGANNDLLLLGTGSESGAQLFAVAIASGSLGAPEQAGSFRSVSAILVSESDNAFVADREADSVFSMTGLRDSRNVSLLVSARDGVSRPVSLYRYRNRLVVGNAGDSTALIVNTESREVSSVPLVSKPTQCQRLGVDGLIAMNEAGAHPVTMVDLAENMSYFVPVDLP